MIEQDETNDLSTLSDYLEEGVSLTDLPNLQSQLAFTEIHQTLAKLFSGSPDKIALKLYVLNEFFASTRHVWKIQEIHQHFSFIKENVRLSLLTNFRTANLIDYNEYHLTYELSDLAYKIQSTLTSLQSVDGEDSIGIITSGLQQTVNLDTDPLPHIQFLIKKLTATGEQYKRAIETRSEDALRVSLEQAEESNTFYDDATKTLQVITDESYKNFNRDIHEAAQEVAEVQSSFSYLATRMKSTLNEIERHKVSLSDFGYNFDELKAALKSRSSDFLADFITPILRKTVRPLFLTDQFIDEASEELFYSEYEDDETENVLHEIDGASSEVVDEERLDHCTHLTEFISAHTNEIDLKTLVTHRSWEESCYRISMLGMLEGISPEMDGNDPISMFRKLPFTVTDDPDTLTPEEEYYTAEELQNTPFRTLSKGHIIRSDET